MADYGANDLKEALQSVGIVRGDILFCHSHLPFYGRPRDVGSAADLCQLFFDGIMDTIGPKGTLIVPAFTYSFPRREVFDMDADIRAMGLFPEFVRRQPGALRSRDPCYSVVAYGGAADALTRGVPENSFGPDSVFDRFWMADGKILSLNNGVGSTYIHYVERRLGVGYRFDKTFEGTIKNGSDLSPARSVIWVRYLSDDSLVADWTALERKCRADGVLRSSKLGRGEVGCLEAQRKFRVIEEALQHHPYFLTKAFGLGITSPRIVPE